MKGVDGRNKSGHDGAGAGIFQSSLLRTDSHKRALDCVPRQVQWRVRQDILARTPFNIGAPERHARQCMPRDLYE